MPRNPKIRLCIMDTGYDSGDLRLIQDSLNAGAFIPFQKKKTEMDLQILSTIITLWLDRDPYHQRNNVETVFSIMKRKFGESLKA
jgi:hypothetical protein